MPDQKTLSERILAVLDGASSPLKAKEIVSDLKKAFGVTATTTEVNSLLYGALAQRVSKQADHRWSAVDRGRATKGAPEVSVREPAPSSQPEPSPNRGNEPACPQCGAPMHRRTASRGSNAGGRFFGCSRYPKCKAVLPLEDSTIGSSGVRATEPSVIREQPNPPPMSNVHPGSVLVTPPVTTAAPSQSIPNDKASNCPTCGSPMLVRTARKGSNAGGQFYGCSRYPQCKTALPIDQDATLNRRGLLEGDDDPGEHPRRISAFANTSVTQAILLECIALPKAAFSEGAWDELSDEYRHSLAQWQLDLPDNPETGGAPQFTWSSVVEKILKRGRATTLSPTLEARLQSLANLPHSETTDWPDLLRKAATMKRPSPKWEDGFDSLEEQLFVEKVLPAMAGPEITGWIQRQVPLDHLVEPGDKNRTERRVDFLLAHPSSLRLVIEIDGAQHGSQIEADDARDTRLEAAGYEVIRIPATEVRNGSGEMLTLMRNRLSAIDFSANPSPHARFVALVRRAHQLQLALWYAVATGLVVPESECAIPVAVCLDEANRSEFDERFIDAVLQDLNELITDVAVLHLEAESCVSFERSEDPDFTVRFTTDYTGAAQDEIYVRDVFVPVTVANVVSAFTAAAAVTVNQPACERILRRIFGYEQFREGQFEAVARCLNGKDTIVLLPTGAGKSIAFQLAAFLRPGVCIVVDPIVSLIEDQIENLHGFGIDRICQITSSLTRSGRQAVLELLAQGEFLFCYVAPERFQAQSFRDSLRELTTHTAVSLVAIDEAHCVSEWGHDFRPAYLNIARISRDYCATDGIAPPLMALTGTASRAVLKDVQRELEIGDYEAIITPSTFDRTELHFRTIACRSNEKMLKLRGVLQQLPRLFGYAPSGFFECRGTNTHSGLVFCPHVEGDFGVIRVSQELSRVLNRRVAFYSGGPPKAVAEKDWQKQKTQIAQSFKRNQLPLMTATKAFGMGIDKPRAGFKTVVDRS